VQNGGVFALACGRQGDLQGVAHGSSFTQRD
jgi:hypothetical protein